MKRLFIFASAIFFHFSSTFSQEWVSLNGKQQREAVNMTVLQSDALGYKVKVTVNGLYDETVQNEKGTFHSLSLGRVERLLTMGSPALPCINQIIAIPPDATMSVSVEEDEWKDLEIGFVYPAQSQFLAENKVFHINDTVYQHSFIPSTVKVGKESTWRGIRHAGVSVCPFKYYPQENRLSVLCSYTLKVEFSQKQITSLQKIDSRFGLFANTVYKNESLGQKNSSSNSNNYDYLILVGNNAGITDHSSFCEKLKQFRIWKALKGLKTKVTYLNTLSMSDYQIRDFIRNEKTNNNISYVLLVGDSIPITTSDTLNYDQTSHIYGDYWYGCEPGMDEADVCIGRFSIASVADFEHMVDKTIKYESSYEISPYTMLIAHKEEAPFPYSYQGCCEAIRTDSLTAGIYFWKAYGSLPSDGGNNATNQMILDEMRTSHYNIINYRGHGGVNSWSNWNVSGESFTSSEINNMDSTRSSVFFSVACNTANIGSNTGCMLESFTRSTHGAVVFIGSTNNSESEANNLYDKIIFRKLFLNNVYRIGDLNLISNIQNIQNYILNMGDGRQASDHALSYLCGGDPTLELWTAHPTRFNATVTPTDNSITINIGNNLGAYTLNVVSVNGDLLNSISCSNSTYTFPIPADKFYFSINKHNCVPYVYYYDRITNEISGVAFTYDAYFEASPIEINNNNASPVIVKPYNRLHIKNGDNGVYIDSFFKCEKGAMLEIK